MSDPTTDREAPGAPVEPGSPKNGAAPRPPVAERRSQVDAPLGQSGASQAESPGARQGAQPATRRPQIGDTRPAPVGAADSSETTSRPSGGSSGAGTQGTGSGSRRRRGGRGRRRGSASGGQGNRPKAPAGTETEKAPGENRAVPGPPSRSTEPAEAEAAPGFGEERPSSRPRGARPRRGRERTGRTTGRYLMCVHVEAEATQIAVLEGRALVEHFVARPQDDAHQIIGNVYRGRVKNVLPGMEAAFVDIGTPKNAVLYWGDVAYDKEEFDRESGANRIEHLLRPGQTIVCQVTKNPIGLKGARLTQEVSLPGRFVVLVPNSSTYGISRRLDDNERKRLRRVLDEVRPEGHGLIVRTAAQGAAADDLRRDVRQLVAKWEEIDERARRLPAPALLYSEPHMAVRIIREELTEEHRAVLIDDVELYEIVKDYVAEFAPDLAERVELYDPSVEPLPLFERHHVHEQLHKALDRKVWLPSGGSLIIERTEALTVIDVNTGKNVGSSSLEDTVFENNLEAAEEIARQLRLRDIGGIIVIDFIDMEVKTNRQAVLAAFKAALARDKTPTQVFDISELGLVEMTRKRVGEGLVETLSDTCPMCNGRGIIFREGPAA
jgi:ribonuclease E